MQTIIRVEHPFDGKGIFNSEKTIIYTDLATLDIRHGEFPTPTKDEGLLYLKRNEFCAFKSINQIKEWIMEAEFKTLAKHGFKIYALDVSECRVGEYQVLYKKENILQQKDITQLFL